IATDKLNKRIAKVGENQRDINGLDQARPLIRAAYQAETGNIIHNTEGSSIFELGDSFVIAALTDATAEGVAPFDDVKPRVELAVRKENKGKALAEKMKAQATGTDLQAIADKLNLTVKTANNITFNSVSIPAVGVEPALVGTVASLKQNEVSEPVVGNNGVYLVKVNSITEGKNDDVQAEQKRLDQTLGYRANYQAYQVHKDAVEIIDKRSKFY
ncbi:MAG TPA: peptidylprolyl isomerase, partial [Sunxiuqinia sp.]|nr:peptidylprolyl isomerase [Sunxiuqinia sp.]